MQGICQNSCMYKTFWITECHLEYPKILAYRQGQLQGLGKWSFVPLPIMMVTVWCIRDVTHLKHQQFANIDLILARNKIRIVWCSAWSYEGTRRSYVYCQEAESEWSNYNCTHTGVGLPWLSTVTVASWSRCLFLFFCLELLRWLSRNYQFESASIVQ